MFSVISTRKDLANIYHCKNLLAIFSHSKIVESTVILYKDGISRLPRQYKRNLSDS